MKLCHVSFSEYHEIETILERKHLSDMCFMTDRHAVSMGPVVPVD